ncbi:MAG: beta/gamma crystallin-related protein [Betaproteobacteria bacterium]
MNSILRYLIVAGTTFAALPAIADVTFYESENFSGRQFSVGQDLNNFRDSGFNDRAKSAIVSGGTWEICVDRDYRGGCTTLAPGRYPNLAGWSALISSARMMAAGPVAAGPVAAQPSSGGITFFGRENFGGRQFAADRSLPNFRDLGFNDRPQSAIVEGASWQLCLDADFSGDCTVLAPGRYPTLGGWAGRISSARPADESRGGMRRDDRRRDDRRGGASATLFSGPNLTGRQVTLGSEGDNQLDRRFNNRASSLRVDRGYWVFCSGEDFRGECQTFGPGEYPTLPVELDNRISSGRRISHDYPYRGQQSRSQ